MRCQGNDRNVTVIAFDTADLLGRFMPRHTRHLDIHKYQVDAVFVGVFIIVLVAAFIFIDCLLCIQHRI